jgi:hypothetical protein
MDFSWNYKKAMNNDRQHNFDDPNSRDLSTNRLERASSNPNDLPDSEEDNKKLQPEETVIDLPDVKDIPGQEFVHVPAMGELGDTTMASDDEEGKRVFDQDDTAPVSTGSRADVNADERRALEQTDYMPTRDADNLEQSRMDNRDEDNEPLNEKGFRE